MTYRLDDSDPNMVIVEIRMDPFNVQVWQDSIRSGQDLISWATLLDARPAERNTVLASVRMSKDCYDGHCTIMKSEGLGLTAIAGWIDCELLDYETRRWSRAFVDELPIVQQAEAGALVATCTLQAAAEMIDVTLGEPDVCSLVGFQRLPYTTPNEVTLVLTVGEEVRTRLLRKQGEQPWRKLCDVVSDVLWDCRAEAWERSREAISEDAPPRCAIDDSDIPF